MDNDDFYELLQHQIADVVNIISNDANIDLITFKKDFKLSIDYLEVFSPEEVFSEIISKLNLDLDYNLAHYNIFTLNQQEALRYVYDLIQKYK
jgi:hypothetical protein